MKPPLLGKLTAVGAALLLSFSANAALSIRDLDGDWSNGHEGVYDDVLDITWLADANYAFTSNYDYDGRMSWADAKSWASDLSFGAFDDWRLPSVRGAIWPDDEGYHDTQTELGHLFYVALGNPGNTDIDTCFNGPEYCMTNIAFQDELIQSTFSFLNVKRSIPSEDVYWFSELSFADNAWALSTTDGGQGLNPIWYERYAWAVHDGDIGASPVPLPAGIYLFLLGLVSLVGAKLRGRNA